MLVPNLDGAKIVQNAGLCIALWGLISKLMSNPTFIAFLTSLRCYMVIIHIFVKDNFLQEILDMLVVD
jgi:hypothetical protein